MQYCRITKSASAIIALVTVQKTKFSIKDFFSKCDQIWKKTKHTNIFRKRNVFYPLIIPTCTYQWVRNIRFSENLACFVFLKHPFWDLHFCLITDQLNIEETYIITNLIKHIPNKDTYDFHFRYGEGFAFNL